MSDEKIFTTRTVCRTIVLILSLESDQCIMSYEDSKSDKVKNGAGDKNSKRYGDGEGGVAANTLSSTHMTSAMSPRANRWVEMLSWMSATCCRRASRVSGDSAASLGMGLALLSTRAANPNALAPNQRTERIQMHSLQTNAQRDG